MKTLPDKHPLGERDNRLLGAMIMTLLVFGLASSSSAHFTIGTQTWLPDGSINSTNASNGLFPYVNDASTANGNSSAFARCQGRIVGGEYILLKLACFDRDNPNDEFGYNRTITQMSDRFSYGLPEWARHDMDVLHLRVRLHGTMLVPTGIGWYGTQPYGVVGVAATYLSGGPDTYRTIAGEAILHGGAWPGNITYQDLGYVEPGTQNLFLDEINVLPPPSIENGYLVWNINKMLYIPLIDAINPDIPVTENTVTLGLWVKGALGNPESGVLINGEPPTCVVDFANSVTLAVDGFGPLVMEAGEGGETDPIPLAGGTVYKFGEQDEEVIAPEPPELRIASLSPTNDAMVIRFSSLSGARYAVDYAARVGDITPSNTVSVIGLENETEAIVPMASSSNGFYRVRYN